MASNEDEGEDSRSSSYYDPPDVPIDSATSDATCLYLCILEAIHSIDLSQTEMKLRRRVAVKILTKVVHKNHKNILLAIHLFRAFEETGKITRYQTLRFLREVFYPEKNRSKPVKLQEKLILDLQQEGTQQRSCDNDRIQCNLCNLCNRPSFKVREYTDFGLHLIEHIEREIIGVASEGDGEGERGETSIFNSNAYGRRHVVRSSGITIERGEANYSGNNNSISKVDGKGPADSLTGINIEEASHGGSVNVISREDEKRRAVSNIRIKKEEARPGWGRFWTSKANGIRCPVPSTRIKIEEASSGKRGKADGKRVAVSPIRINTEEANPGGNEILISKADRKRHAVSATGIKIEEACSSGRGNSILKAYGKRPAVSHTGKKIEKGGRVGGVKSILKAEGKRPAVSYNFKVKDFICWSCGSKFKTSQAMSIHMGPCFLKWRSRPFMFDSNVKPDEE